MYFAAGISKRHKYECHHHRQKPKLLLLHVCQQPPELAPKNIRLVCREWEYVLPPVQFRETKKETNQRQPVPSPESARRANNLRLLDYANLRLLDYAT